MTNLTIDTTTKPQERVILDPLKDDVKIDVIKRLSLENIKLEALKTSPLKERVSPRSASSPEISDDENSDFSYDDDGDLEFPVSDHKYVESKDSDSDCFTSPDSSPYKAPKKTPDTPQTLKTFSALMDNHDPGYDLSPESKAQCKGVLEKFNTWDSPYKARDSARKLFGAKLAQTGSVTEVPSPIVGRRLIFAAPEYEDISGEWTTNLAKELKVSFLDVKHLTDLERAGGFHICGQDHPRDRSVIKRRTNIWTDIWCGQVCKEEDPAKILKQFSSFIPRHMNLDRYQFLISQAMNTPNCKVAQQGNRYLYRLVDENTSFVVECYLQEEGTRIKSAIPVFQYEVYNGKDTQFRVVYLCQESLDNEECIATYDVTYEKLFELLRTCPKEAIVYDLEDKIIVDAGILFGTPNQDYDICPIEKGVLVEIPKIYSNFIL